MSILDEVLGDGKDSFYPVNDDRLHEEELASADKAGGGSPAGTDPPAADRYGMSEGQREYLQSRGYTPDRVDRYMTDFDPSTAGQAFRSNYTSAVKAPDPVDEKKIKRAKTTAVLTDSIGLLAQMFAQGRGAHVARRDPGSSGMAQVEGKERELRHLYTQRRDAYDTGLYDAQGKDLLQALQEHREGKKGLWDLLDDYDKRRASARQEELKAIAMEREQANKDRDYALNKQKSEESSRHNATIRAQGWSRLGKAEDKRKGVTTVTVAANSRDDQAVRDSLGKAVRHFELQKDEVDRYKQKALSDPAFMRKHPEFFQVKRDQLGNVSGVSFYPGVKDTDIAGMYIQEVYDDSYRYVPYLTDDRKRGLELDSPWSKKRDEKGEDWGMWINP